MSFALIDASDFKMRKTAEEDCCLRAHSTADFEDVFAIGEIDIAIDSLFAEFGLAVKSLLFCFVEAVKIRKIRI